MSSPSPSSTLGAVKTVTLPASLKIVGVLLAVASGFLIGSSFVFKKKGLLRSQAGAVAGEGVAYLKSPLWWTGMVMMIAGEICNFAAYAFVEALVVTPLGALSVVICAILSSIFLKEKLTFFGWLGCSLCILGSIIIALNTPPEATVGHINDFKALFLSPGFLGWGSFLIAASLSIMFYFGPRYGKNSMFWYIGVCSMIGGLSVSCTTGLGAAIVTSVMGDNQFKNWFTYFLLVFVAVTLVTEVYFLNMALALFNTAMVTPTYYVIFTFCTLVTTIVLFQGLKASATQIITLVTGFLVICVGITILQLSKVDPTSFTKLDRKSTILLQASRNRTEMAEKDPLMDLEEPGVDALRGGLGTIGTIIRARSMHRLSQGPKSPRANRMPASRNRDAEQGQFESMQRHQLYDPPVGGKSGSDNISMKATSPGGRTPTIKFQSEDIRHFYPTSPGRGNVVHSGMPGTPEAGVPRLPPPNELSGSRTAPPRMEDRTRRKQPSARGYPVVPEAEEAASLVSGAAPEAGANESDSDMTHSESSHSKSGGVRLVPPRAGMI